MHRRRKGIDVRFKEGDHCSQLNQESSKLQDIDVGAKRRRSRQEECSSKGRGPFNGPPKPQGRAGAATAKISGVGSVNKMGSAWNRMANKQKLRGSFSGKEVVKLVKFGR